MSLVVEVKEEEEDGVNKFLLPDTPSTILSIPIIKKLTANISINRNRPKKGLVRTINDTTIDNIPTPYKKCSWPFWESHIQNSMNYS